MCEKEESEGVYFITESRMKYREEDGGGGVGFILVKEWQ